MRRRSVAVRLLLALDVALLGCTHTGDDAPATTTVRPRAELRSCETLPAGRSVETGHPVEITLWHSERTASWEVMSELVQEFDRAHPGVIVHVENVGGGREGVLDHWRATAPEHRPSLALMAEDGTRLLADSGQTLAPGTCLAEAVTGLVPVIEASWSVGGVLQAVPFAVSTPVLVYNRRAFRDAGLDPDRPPASLDELRDASHRLVDHGVVPTGLVVDPRGNGPWFVEQWNAQAGVLSLAPANGHRGVAERAVWQDGSAVDHLAWLQAMVADGLASPVEQNPQGSADLVALATTPPGAAMALHTSGSLVELIALLEAARLPGFELGVSALPGPGTGSLPGGAALWLSAARSADETRAAWSLAAFLASPGVQARWAAATGYIPITSEARRLEPLDTAWERQPVLAVPYEVLRGHATTAAALGMSVGPEGEVHDLMGGAVAAVVLDGVDPADALRDAARDADGLLEAYNHGLEAQPDDSAGTEVAPRLGTHPALTSWAPGGGAAPAPKVTRAPGSTSTTVGTVGPGLFWNQ